MSTNRQYSTYSKPQPMGTNGRKACLQCGGNITAKRRSTFCDEKCADNFRLKTSAGHVRVMVFQRDLGVCALCVRDVFEGTGRKPRATGTGDLWQADHITPVIEGGGECGLDNFRTLCTACHKGETAALAKRRAQARKLAAVPQSDLNLDASE